MYGKFLAYVSFLPFAIIIAFSTLTLFVRDVHVVGIDGILFVFLTLFFWAQISFFAGQLGNEVVNMVLKHKFAESRPEQVPNSPNANESHGWPSNHTQFQSFFFVYSLLCICTRLRQSGASKLFMGFLVVVNYIALFLVYHSRLVFLIDSFHFTFNSKILDRTYLLYHFNHQCLHGCLIGSVIAIVWFIIVFKIIEPLFWKPFLKS